MKNHKLLIGIMVALTAFIILCVVSAPHIGKPIKKEQYQSGRDTYRAFGDGQIQILWFSKSGKILFDVKNQKRLLSEIEKWGENKSDLFFAGKLNKKRKFLVLSSKTNEIVEYADLNEIPEIHKDIFEKLK